jgi:hypothetical protein
VARAGSNPFVHFLTKGIYENRKPTVFLRPKADFSRFADRPDFLSNVYSPAELFEVESPFELTRGDFAALGGTTLLYVPSNLFFGEPAIRDSADFELMLDVYRSYMEAHQ